MAGKRKTLVPEHTFLITAYISPFNREPSIMYKINHAGIKNDGYHATYADRDKVIEQARRLALMFNTQLFVKDIDSETAVELPVDPESTVDSSLLAKVRKLIAKAERTDIDAEREAFLAKAQEWMVRHAMDESLVKGEPKTEFIERRLIVGKHGAGIWAKRNLAYAVAGHANCRGWSNTGAYYNTVAGFREDVEWADLLFTSLLLQMEQELSTAERPEWTPWQTFRTNFMDAFVRAVKDRLHRQQVEALRATVELRLKDNPTADESADATTSVAMVLRDRKAKVDEWVDGNHKFVNVTRNMGAYCGSSEQQGMRAGERADLSGGRTGRIGATGRLGSGA